MNRQKLFNKKLEILKDNIIDYLCSKKDKNPINIVYFSDMFECSRGFVDKALYELITENRLDDYDVVDTGGLLFLKKIDKYD
jgi:hypothetical protein